MKTWDHLFEAMAILNSFRGLMIVLAQFITDNRFDNYYLGKTSENFAMYW